MSQKRRPAKKTPSAEESALTAKQREIVEKQEQVKAEMERYQKLIEDAPRIAKEHARKRRDQFVIRASRTEQRGSNRAALPDRRYDLDPGAPARQKRLRAERNRGRRMFFFLLLTFAGVIAWLYFAVVHRH